MNKKSKKQEIPEEVQEESQSESKPSQKTEKTETAIGSAAMKKMDKNRNLAVAGKENIEREDLESRFNIDLKHADGLKDSFGSKDTNPTMPELLKRQ